MATSGAILSLDAVGKQDLYLDSPDPHDSLFHYTLPERHSKFAKYEKVQRLTRPSTTALTESWPFGKTVTTFLNPQELGDIMTDLVIRVQLPELLDARWRLSTYCKDIAWSLLDNVNIRIDELDIETIYGDSMMIYYNLYADTSERRALKAGVGGDGTGGPQTVYLVLPTFFNHKNPFPLCAIHKQKIRMSMSFNPPSAFSDTTDVISIPHIDVIMTVADLTLQERQMLISKDIERVFTLAIRQPIQEIPEDTGEARVKFNLVGSDNVKTIVWFFRRDIFEQLTDIDYFNQRMNLSNVVSDDQDDQNLNPIMSTADIYINNNSSLSPLVDVSRSNISTRNYYKFNPNFRPPLKDIYSYTFALNPMNTAPSGLLDMSKTNSNGSFLQVKLNKLVTEAVQFHGYYIIDKKFTISRGFMSSS
jgi:hypothetical protein